MFDFFRKRRKPKLSSKDISDLSRNMVEGMFAELDNFMEVRARPTTEGLLDIFIERINRVEVGDPKHSPVDLARGEAIIFIDELENFLEARRLECEEVMEEWNALCVSLGQDSAVPLAITQRFHNLRCEIVERCANEGGPVVKALEMAGYKAERFL